MELPVILESKSECQAYELGKHHWSALGARVNNGSSNPFHLVHSNIWVPCFISIFFFYMKKKIYIDQSTTKHLHHTRKTIDIRKTPQD